MTSVPDRFHVGTVAFAMSGALGMAIFALVLSADFYATAALIGGLAYVVCDRSGVPGSVTSIAAFGVTFLLRVMAIRRGWHLPRLPA